MLKSILKLDSFLRKFIKNNYSIIVICLLLALISISSYIYPNVIIEGNENMNLFKKKYSEMSSSGHPTANTMGLTKKQFNNLFLRDFYIKSSYNSCAIDNKSNILDLDAIPILARQGVRFFDFQIFSIADENDPNKTVKPFVAINKTGNTSSITSDNQILLEDVLSKIKNVVFSRASAPNYKDPVFINLRMCTTIPETYNKVAKLLRTKLKLYYSEGGRKRKKNNIGNIKYRQVHNSRHEHFRTFVFIESQLSDNDLEKTIYDKTPHLNALKNVFLVGTNTLVNIDYEKVTRNDMLDNKATRMTIASPPFVNENDNITNISFPTANDCNGKTPCYPKPMKYGCQFMPMSYNSEIDKASGTSIISYNVMFDTLKSGMIVKEPDLRYIPEKIPILDTSKMKSNDSINSQMDNAISSSLAL